MAQAPDGKSVAKERVVFTRPAAQRIARVVRTVESGDRSQQGLVFDPQFLGRSTLLRRATFSGGWAIGTTKTVTFVQGRTATASATNLTWPLGDATDDPQTCLVGKEGTSWWLIVPSLSIINCDTKASSQQLSFFSG